MSHQHKPEYGLAPPLHEVQKTPKGPWIVFLVVALLAVGGVTYGPRAVEAVRAAVRPAAVEEPPPAPVAKDPDMRRVAFEVTGVGKAFTITTTAGASVKSETSVTLPWFHFAEIPVGAPDTVMLVVVAGPEGNEVHGKYTIDGTTVRTGSAHGPYGVLTITDS
ncbi:hypothetical protein [Lentzea sp.]|uniref:hypothetical protein n=1 Tax=Lentzea sp. TaxID=56099 RepID=UPI002C61B44D|nr:hypothetical protein [Lentzea sp.]HUQ60270.1 hypothetical protein [Lentzea sp.]